MIFDDFDNAMEANEIHGSDRDECNEFLDATGNDVSEFADEPGENEFVCQEFSDDVDFDDFDDSMDGDHDSAMKSAGWGTDEDYGDYGPSDWDGEF